MKANLRPEAGFHNITSTLYHGWDLPSAHRLEILHHKSPAHLKHEIDNPRAQTEAMRLGEAVHCAVLEPELFRRDYVPSPKFDRRTKEGKAGAAEFEAKHAGKKILAEDEFSDCLRISDAVLSHSDARLFLGACEQKEVSGVFDDATGLRCKFRADAISRKLGAIIDLKTTKSAHPRSFSRDIYNYGYHRQGALYVEGACSLGIEVRHFVIIAVEKCAPYGVGVYRLGGDALALGRQQSAELRHEYSECLKLEKWPGYSDGVVDISVPEWALKELYTEEVYE
jgi:hypothetical protein